MAKPLRIGMIGYGFMGRAHSNGYCKVNHFFDLEYRPVLKAACARSEERVQAFADQWGYESVETDWRKLIARDDIDAIDIGSPSTVRGHSRPTSKGGTCEVGRTSTSYRSKNPRTRSSNRAWATLARAWSVRRIDRASSMFQRTVSFS